MATHTPEELTVIEQLSKARNLLLQEIHKVIVDTHREHLKRNHGQRGRISGFCLESPILTDLDRDFGQGKRSQGA